MTSMAPVSDDELEQAISDRLDHINATLDEALGRLTATAVTAVTATTGEQP